VMALSVNVDESRPGGWATVVVAEGLSDCLASPVGGTVSRPVARDPFPLLFGIASDGDDTKLDRPSTVVVSLFCLSARMKSSGA